MADSSGRGRAPGGRARAGTRPPAQNVQGPGPASRPGPPPSASGPPPVSAQAMERANLPIRLAQIIHKGTYGNMFVAKHGDDICAVKTIVAEKIPDNVSTDSIMKAAQEEVQNSQLFDCDTLLKMITIHLTKPELFIVMPLMAYESTSKIMEKYFPYGMPEAAISMIMRDVLKGISYMFDRYCIHRAVCGRHILINEHGAAMLTGFDSMLRLRSSDTLVPRITNMDVMKNRLNWLSPEMLHPMSNGYSYPSDVYSVGITAIELANGAVPFAEEESSVIKSLIIRGQRPELWDKTYVLAQDPNLELKVPRAPVSDRTGSPDLPSTSSSSGCDVNTARKETEKMNEARKDAERIKQADKDAKKMNEVYGEKEFSEDFKIFLESTLDPNPNHRVSSDIAQWTGFIQKYMKCPTADLLACLNLSNPVQINEGELGEELKLRSRRRERQTRRSTSEPPVEVLYVESGFKENLGTGRSIPEIPVKVLYAPGRAENWRAHSDSSD